MPPFSSSDFSAATALLLTAPSSPAGKHPWAVLAVIDGLTICKRPRQAASGDGALNEYLVSGEIADAGFESVHDTFMDLDYRKAWDNYKEDQIRVLGGAGNAVGAPSPDDARSRSMTLVDAALAGHSTDAIHWRMEYPWPMATRDYIITRESRKLNIDGVPCFVVLQATLPPSVHSVDAPAAAEGVIRVTSYAHSILLRPSRTSPSSATEIFYHYYENPGGSIPSSVYNWAVSIGIPAWVRRFKRACLAYGNPEAREEVLQAGMKDRGMREGVKELEAVLEESMDKAFAI